MPTNRCGFNVVDPETKRTRKCKNLKCKISKYCLLHFKFLYIKHILLIQSIFRGNKIRNKLNNIYFKLPDDLQRLIISKEREYLSYNKYKKTINNIINKRIDSIISFNYKTILNNINNNLYIQSILHLCSLLNKYYRIYDFEKNNNINFYRLVKNIIYSYDLDYVDTSNEIVKYYDLYSELKYKIPIQYTY